MRQRLDPKSFYLPYEPKEFIFGDIKSGISYEELKKFYLTESMEFRDDPLPGMDFKDVTVKNCSHLKVNGECKFTLLNNRLSKVVFNPVDEESYESAVSLLLGVKGIKRGEEYYLNKHITLSKALPSLNKSYFWLDKRYSDEEIYFID